MRTSVLENGHRAGFRAEKNESFAENSAGERLAVRHFLGPRRDIPAVSNQHISLLLEFGDFRLKLCVDDIGGLHRLLDGTKSLLHFDHRFESLHVELAVQMQVGQLAP